MTILEKSSTTNTTIASASYEAINALTYTSAEVADGNYLAVVTVDIDAPSSDFGNLNIAISQGGSIVTHTEREVENESSHDVGFRRTMCIIAHINKTSGQALEVHWKRLASGTWNALGRSFCLFPAASGDFTSVQQTGNSTLDSTTYTALPSSTFTTPASGDYLMNFTCSGFQPTDAVMNFAVFVGGTIVAHSERALGANSSFADVEENFLISVKVSPNGSEDVEIRWRREAATGTITCLERSSVLLKLGTAVGVVEASSVVNDSDSTTSDQIIDDMTISNPISGQYLAIFGGYMDQSTIGADNNISFSTFVATTEEADTDRINVVDASNNDGNFPVATSGIVNPDGTEDVTQHWQGTETDARIMHDRTLILLAEFEQPAGAIPVVESDVSTNVTSNATTMEVTKPSGIVDNDFVIIGLALDGDAGNANMDGETGWTRAAAVSEGAVELFVFYKLITNASGEPSTWTIDWTGNQQARAQAVRVSGVQTSGDPTQLSASNTGSSTVSVGFVIVTAVDNMLGLAFHCRDRDRIDSSSVITSNGWTVEVGTPGSSGGANGAGLLIGEQGFATSGTNTGTNSVNEATDQWCTQVVTLRPTGGAVVGVRGIAMNPSVMI